MLMQTGWIQANLFATQSIIPSKKKQNLQVLKKADESMIYF